MYNCICIPNTYIYILKSFIFVAFGTGNRIQILLTIHVSYICKYVYKMKFVLYIQHEHDFFILFLIFGNF